MYNPATLPRVDGTFPVTTPRADSSYGTKDGTPLHKEWVTDVFAFMQAALNGASMSPNGNADTVSSAVAGNVTGSQLIEALQLMLGVPGEIVGWPGDTLPTGARLLKLEGQCVSLTTYPRLANVYCGNANNPSAPAFYKTSDAGGTTRSTSGGYMVLADYTGLFLRGRDVAEDHDPSGSTRKFGDTQLDSLEAHTHTGLYDESDHEVVANTGAVPGTDYRIDYTSTLAGDTLHTGDITTGGRTPTAETRPVNSVVTWCIRY